VSVKTSVETIHCWCCNHFLWQVVPQLYHIIFLYVCLIQLFEASKIQQMVCKMDKFLHKGVFAFKYTVTNQESWSALLTHFNTYKKYPHFLSYQSQGM